VFFGVECNLPHCKLFGVEMNKFLSLNRQLVLLPWLTLLLSSGPALAIAVGNGTPDSCTDDAFTNAVAQGGTITFNCGSSPYTLTVNSEKTISSDTIIDGGNLVTLSGGNSHRILSIKSYYDHNDPSLTVQNLTFANGNSSSVNDSGGAIYRLGGTLSVINSKFFNNVGPVTGQDVAGGAIYSVGGGTTSIDGSDFEGNQASNGGAIGNLGSALTITNSTISGNTATGNGGNPGNGGNGGGIYIDGVNSYFGVAVNLSGVQVTNNKGNAYGGGIFRVAYNGEPTTIDQCSFTGNSIPNQSPSLAGGLYLQGTSISMTNSTVSNNSANVAGGMYVGPYSTLSLSNDDITQNTAYVVGGGLFVDNNVSSGGTLSLTIANNQANAAAPNLANNSPSLPF